MDHFENIYRNQADAYHRMIAVEDTDEQIIKTIRAICPPNNKIIYDLGSGTGRLPILLSNYAQKLISIDLHRNMLEEQTRQMRQIDGKWNLIQADIRNLPFPSSQANLVTAGWAIGHMRAWFADDWKQQINAAVSEMLRLALNGGWLIIFETLGTGTDQPHPPSPELAEYYDWLENYWGFTHQEITTDYQFSSVEDAEEKTGFFFSNELVAKISQNQWARVPEWTGVWSKQK